MIQAKELRIGNLVNQDIPVEVEAWMLLPDSRIVFKPIPLTEEWILKFGFIHNGIVISGKKYYRLRVEKFTFIYVENECVYIWFYDDRKSIDCEFISDVIYVHQLQNLYFALTGEELQLQSPVL